VEESTDSFTPNFIPIGAWVEVWDPKTKHFTKISAYKRPTEAYPLCNFFTKVLSIVDSFMCGQVSKFGRIQSRVFQFWGIKFTPKISAPHSGETMRQRRTCFVGASKVQTYSIIMPSLVGFVYRGPARAKTLIFWFFFPFSYVRHAFK